MNNIKIQIQYDCPACKATGTIIDPDYDETEPFPLHSPMQTCEKCNGKKIITAWCDLGTCIIKAISEDQSAATRKIEVPLFVKAKPVDHTIDETSGFTLQEKECHDALMNFYDLFLKLERQHPDELRDAVDPIHRLQDLMIVRIVRRCYPKKWPTHKNGVVQQ